MRSRATLIPSGNARPPKIIKTSTPFTSIPDIVVNWNHRKRLFFVWAFALVAACAPATPPAPPLPSRPPEPPISELYARLSEQGGYFDSDNLISNETSYLHALDDLRAKGVRGGAYIGVGPDQSFSYIAEIKPELEFSIDIRRDY